MIFKHHLSYLIFTQLMLASSFLYAVDNCQMLSNKKLFPNSSQIVVVQSLGGFKANMTLCQRQGTQWKSVLKSPFDVVLGKNGVASIGNKKEGDLKTPAGLYPIGEAFGIYPLALKMDYKYITQNDKFIDDVHHQLYNTWVHGPSDAKSYETMLIKPYTYGAVINYNMNPRKAGLGSAIFIHLWDTPHSPTSGCIAFDKKHLLILLRWLDKAQYPSIFIIQNSEGQSDKKRVRSREF
jgi:L,D-peptidoglycan transpeptidase YkuD (ErfK/YbiS/YcfS/YnhG family)